MPDHGAGRDAQQHAHNATLSTSLAVARTHEDQPKAAAGSQAGHRHQHNGDYDAGDHDADCEDRNRVRLPEGDDRLPRVSLAAAQRCIQAPWRASTLCSFSCAAPVATEPGARKGPDSREAAHPDAVRRCFDRGHKGWVKRWRPHLRLSLRPPRFLGRSSSQGSPSSARNLRSPQSEPRSRGRGITTRASRQQATAFFKALLFFHPFMPFLPFVSPQVSLPPGEQAAAQRRTHH